MQKFLRTLTLLALIAVPWVAQGQTAAKVSEYDVDVTRAAYTTLYNNGGTAVDMSTGTGTAQLLFAMPFGESTIASGTAVTVNANGSIQFGDGQVVAPLMLSGTSVFTGGTVLVQSTATSFVVECRKAVTGSNSLSFQVALFPSGNIEFRYGPMTLSGSTSVVVGMKDGDNDIYRVGTSANRWDTVVRATSNWNTTRALSSAYYYSSTHPAYSTATGQGVVYTFTQPACVKPSGVTVANPTFWDSLFVSWEAYDGATKYEVYVTDATAEPTEATSGIIVTSTTAHVVMTAGEITGYHVGGLQGSTEYRVYVRKYCGDIKSGWAKYNGTPETPASCPAPAASNFTLSNAGVASWTLTSYPNITSIDIYYSTENVAPDADATPTISNIAVSAGSIDLGARADIAATSNTTWYVWFRGHCTVDGGTTLNWVSKSFRTPFSGDTYIMGTDKNVTSCNAVVYDHGGPSGNYESNRRDTIVIRPGTAYNYVRLYGGTYQTEGSSTIWDYLTVYNGVGTNGTQLNENRIGGGTAGTIPEFVSSDPTGALTVTFYSDGSTVGSGYEFFISCIPMPDCTNPGNFTVTNGEVSWMAGRGNTGFIVKYGEVGFNPENEGVASPSLSATTTSYTLQNLKSNHTYDVYIKASCTDELDWVGPVSFTTPCLPMAITADNPFVENFENYNASSSGVKFEADCWLNEHISGSGTYFFEVYSGTNAGNTTKQLRLRDMSSGTMTKLVLPPMNLPNDNCRFVLDVYRNATGTSYPGEGIRVFVSTDGEIEGATELAWISRNITQTDGNLIPAESATGWYTYELPIGISGDVYIILRGESLYGSHTYMDNFIVEQIPTCIKPTNLAAVPGTGAAASSAVLSWTENTPTPATQWEVRYWKGTDTMSVIANANPYTLNYLDMGTAYGWQVRSLCSTDDQSAWSAESSFETTCLSPNKASVGTATTTTSYAPFYNYYTYDEAKSQQIFTAAEMGNTALTISGITYEISSSYAYDDEASVQIYLGETTKSTFSSGSDWIADEDLTLVYEGDFYIGSAGTYTVNLDNSFSYSGTNNLVVYVKCDNPVGGSVSFRSLPSSSNKTIYRYTSSYSTSNSRTGYRNNFTFFSPCDQGDCVPPTVAITTGPDGDNAKADLTFTGDEEAYGYVYGLAGFTPNIANGTTVTGNTATITPLVPETAYDLYVYSVCTGVENPRMVRYSFTTPFVPTCKVQTGFATSDVTYTGATVSWQQEDPTQVPDGGWKVRYAVNNPVDLADATTYTEQSAATASYTFSGLHHGDHIYMYTKAICVVGTDESTWTGYDFQLPVIEAPTAVASFHTTNISDSLRWTEATEGIDSWTVAYATEDFDPTDATAQYETLAATNDRVKLTGLEPYTTYYVYVRANSGDEHSEWSAPHTVTTVCPDPQEVNVYGESEGSNYNYPVNNYYNYCYTQQIVTADEIGGAKTFSGIRFYYNNYWDNPTKENVTIYVGYTTKDAFSSTSDWIEPSTLTAVFNGDMTFEYGANEFVFTAPFEYNGTDNLVVAIDGSESGYEGSSSSTFVTYSTSDHMTLYWANDSYPVLDGSTFRAGTLADYRAKMDLVSPCNTDVTCFAPTMRNTTIDSTNNVMLRWSANTSLEPASEDFEVSFGATGYNPDLSGAAIATFTVNGKDSLAIANTYFEGNTTYDVYVRSLCGTDDHSKWTKSTFKTYPDLFAPADLTATTPTTDASSSMLLSWTDKNLAAAGVNRWEVAYGLPGFDRDTMSAPKTATTRTNFAVTGLKHSTLYDFYVRAKKGDKVSDWSLVASKATGCAPWTTEELPIVENFDNYSNYKIPACWDTLNTSSYISNQTYVFYNTSTYQYAILPELASTVDVSNLTLDLAANFQSNSCSLTVGVMTNPDDATTFTEVAAIQPTSTDSWQDFTVNFETYEGTGKYVALKGKGYSSGSSWYSSSYYPYIDNVTLKVTEQTNLLDADATLAICNEYIMPDTTGNDGNYAADLNRTYVIRPADAGKVVRLKGTVDLEQGYDFLRIYRGAATAANLIGTYTGSEAIDLMTSSYQWADSGYYTLVLTTDDGNGLAHYGFKLMASCECPALAPAIEVPVEEVAEYTWTAPAGNGKTFTNHMTRAARAGENTDLVPTDVKDIVYTQKNVGGCDSIEKTLQLVLHPDFVINYGAQAICERDTFHVNNDGQGFYGKFYTTTGNYSDTLKTVHGADSIGIVALQRHEAPVAFIYYNNEDVTGTTVADFCDQAAMTLEGRANMNATFRWEDASEGVNHTVAPHERDTFTVVAVDAAHACPSLPVSVMVTTTPVAALSISASDSVICRGESTTLTLADANNLEATYRWSTNQAGTSITVSPTETTTYTVTATTSNESACQTSASFTVMVNQLPEVTLTTSAPDVCRDSALTLSATDKEGYTYLWSNNATTAQTVVNPSVSGTYSVTVTETATGCVKDFTTATVTVNPSYTVHDTMTVCYTQNPYTWGSQTLTEDGNYVQNFKIGHSCDSLVYVDFSFQQISTINTRIELCEGASYTWGGTAYTANRDTTVHFVSTPEDCPVDSVLILTVNRPATSTFERTVCDSTRWNDVLYTESGAHEQVLSTTKGCDSTVTMNLTVNKHSYAERTVDHACNGYAWNAETYTTAGDYVQEFPGQDVNGCDSTETLHLLVVDTTTVGDTSVVWCESRSFTWWATGETYLISRDIAKTWAGAAANGCDSITRLHLTMNYVSDTLNWVDSTVRDVFYLTTIDCDGNTSEEEIRTSGRYEFRIPNATVGHDQWYRVNLTVNTSVNRTDIVSACVPYEFRLVYYMDTITGKDSIVRYENYVKGANDTILRDYPVTTLYDDANVAFNTEELGYDNGSSTLIWRLRFTAKHPGVHTIEDTICANDTWVATNNYTVNGSELVAGQVTTRTWATTEDASANGCDSLEQVALMVNPVYNANDTLTFCESEFDNGEYVVENPNNAEQTVTLTLPATFDGVYENSITTTDWTTAMGCDSNVTYVYTVKPILRETVKDTACREYVWEMNGKELKESGLYYDTIQSELYGCDSIVTLDLTVVDTMKLYETFDYCTEYKGPDGETYRTTKTFETHVGTSRWGCDTILYSTYVIHGMTTTVQNVVTNQPYTWNGNVYEESVSGVQYDASPSSYGCDSVVILNLTMKDEITLCETSLPYSTDYGVTIEDTTTLSYINFDIKDANIINVGLQYTHDFYLGIVFPANTHPGVTEMYGGNMYYNNTYPGTFTMLCQAYNSTDGTRYIEKTLSLTEDDSTGWIPFVLDEAIKVKEEDVLYIFVRSTDQNYPVVAASDQSVSPYGTYLYNNGWYPTKYAMLVEGLVGRAGDNSYEKRVVANDTITDTLIYYTVNPTLVTNTDSVKCDQFVWNGNTYTESGMVSDTLSSLVTGCDSIVNISLTINHSTDSVITQTACNEYTWSGITFKATGDYVIDTNAAGKALTNALGCDSTATLHLTINANTPTTTEAIGCGEYYWIVDNNNWATYSDTIGQRPYTVSGEYIEEVRDANGCYAMDTLRLTINDVISYGNRDSIVNLYSTYYKNVLFTAPFNSDTLTNDELKSLFIDTLSTAAGCDSVLYTHFRVELGTIVNDTNNVCGRFTWMNGHTYEWIPVSERQNGNPIFNYKDVTANAYIQENPLHTTYTTDLNGNSVIDTTYVLWLTMSEAAIADSVYERFPLSQESLTIGDSTFDFSAYKAAKKNDTVQREVHYGSTYYCDSIEYWTINLVYNYDTIDTVYICYEDTTYGALPTGVVTMVSDTAAKGTDSEQITVTPVYRRAAISETLAEAFTGCDSYTFGTEVFTADSNNIDITRTVKSVTYPACDSLVTFRLNITKTVHNVETVELCPADTATFRWHGRAYTASTVDTFASVNSANAQCMDVDTLKLTVKPSFTFTTDSVKCDQFVWNNETFTEDSIIKRTLTASNGCDSVVTINLTVFNTSVASDDTIDYRGGSYRLNGHLYQAPYSGVIDSVYKNVAGCDSLVHIHLFVQQYEIDYDNVVACGLYTWPVNNHTYQWISAEDRAANGALYKDFTTGEYVRSFPFDTVDIALRYLNLTLNEAAFGDTIVDRFPLSQDTLFLGNDTLDFSAFKADKKDTTVNVWYHAGHNYYCDSLVYATINLVYDYNTISQNVCYTVDTFLFNGNKYAMPTAAQTYTFTEVFDAGTPDEQVTTAKVYRRAFSGSEPEETQCDSYAWMNADTLVSTLTTSGTYMKTFVDQYGCDSVVTLTLTVNHNTSHRWDSITMCDSYTWYGREYTTVGTVTDTASYTTAEGCYSVDTITITINKNYGKDTAVVACDKYTWHGDDYYTSSTYYHDSTDVVTGCYHKDTLWLTVNETNHYDSIIYAGEGSYRYKGIMYTSDVNLYDTALVKTVNGCDSIYDVQIHIGTNYYATDLQIVCSEYTWRNGVTYQWISDEERAANGNALYKTSTGDYIQYMPTYVKHNENDYDSIYTLNLTLTQRYVGSKDTTFFVSNKTLAYGDSTFDFTAQNTRAYNVLGFSDSTFQLQVVYSQPTVKQYCDSIIMLNVTLKNNYVDSGDVHLCFSDQSYTWRGKTLNLTTTDYDHVHGPYRIYDTLATGYIEYVSVYQHPISYSTDRRTVCDSFEWIDGKTYTESTSTPTYTLPDKYGCDSVVSLVLTVKYNSNAFTEMTNYCGEYTWTTVDGHEFTYDHSIDTAYRYTAENGCPSVDSLHFVFNDIYNVKVAETVCDQYVWEGYVDPATNKDTVILTNGTYKHTFESVAGCDSTVTLTLTINHNTNTALYDTTYYGDTYNWHGEDYTYTDTYYYSYNAPLNNCPSVDTLYLHMGTGVKTVTGVMCDTLTWHGTTYSVADMGGQEQATFYYMNKTATGKNLSQDTLVLTLHQSTVTYRDTAVCHTITWNGISRTNATNSVLYDTLSYIHPLEVNEEGCPVIDTLYLTLGTSRIFVYEEVVNCGPYEWVVNGQVIDTLTESMETSASIPTASGCDSVINLTLTLKNAPVVDTFATLCASQMPYTWRGTEMTESGVESVVFPMENGCDSTIRFTLTVNPVYETSLTAQICLGQGYEENGFAIAASELAEAGEYTFTNNLSSAEGCDSVVTLTLTVGNIITASEEAASCDSYVWNGTVYTQSGDYTYSYNNDMGCASVDTLHLTIHVNHGVTENQTVCTSYTWNGTEYTEAGTYRVHFADENGCFGDSVLNLSIAPAEQLSYERSACDSYLWSDGDSATYTESGTYTYAYTTADGCSGIATLYLTVNHAEPTHESVVACNSYSWNGTTYTESGVYTSETTDENGCSAVDTLTLTLNSTLAESIDTAVCGMFIWNGMAYNESGSYQQTFTSVNGCDSVVTMNLTINEAITNYISVETCSSYLWNGVNYSTSGVYTQPFTTESGCDSIVTLTLTIGDVATSDTAATACGSFEWHGTSYSQSGVYTYTYSEEGSCDSVVTLTLTINAPANTTESAVACDSYTWNGTTYTASGVYTNTFTDANGCEATATLNLTINEGGNTVINETVCDSYTLNGMTYTTSGVYTQPTVSDNGCLGTITLNLTINESVTVTEQIAACGSYTWNGTTYTTSQTLSNTTTGSNGCDSTTTVVLTINNAQAVTVAPVSACGSYAWNGQIITTSGNYSYTTDDVHGCDSTTTIHVTINNTTYGDTTAVACGSYIWNGVAYTQTGDYQNVEAYTNMGGCDSIVTLHLTINNPVDVEIDETACDSYTWSVDGQTYTTSGTYVSPVMQTVNGCDSTVTLNLTVNHSSTYAVTTSAVGSYEWNGETYTESGVYTWTGTNAEGCDSTVTLTLTVTPATYTVMIGVNDPMMGNVTNGGMREVASGETITVTASPNTGYHFVDWSNGSTEATITVVVTSDTVLTANFAINTYVIEAVASDATMGTVTGSGEYTYGATVVLEATAHDGYRFVRWSTGETDAHIEFVATEDVSVIAYFESVGIDDVDDNTVEIYSTDSRIIVKGAENKDVYVYDVNGRCVRRQAQATETIEFTMSVSGVYLVKVGDMPAKRVVVIR